MYFCARIRLSVYVSKHDLDSSPTGTGLLTDWHLAHQGQFSMRGVGLIITEASAVLPNGRITPEDAGIWTDDQIAGHKRVVDFHHSQGAAAGIQLSVLLHNQPNVHS